MTSKDGFKGQGAATDAFRSISNAEHSPACVRLLIAHPELEKFEIE
jgi:hypothetical protein